MGSMHVGMGCRCSVHACTCIRGSCAHEMSNKYTKSFILLLCEAWAPTLVSIYTTPLSGYVRNSHPFEWTPLLDKCFESIKTLACKAPILKPIDNNNPDTIWVITDGSKAGVGAIYGQGPDWKMCQPARFLFKEFSNAQQHY